jgi:hypothetical protein
MGKARSSQRLRQADAETRPGRKILLRGASRFAFFTLIIMWSGWHSSFVSAASAAVTDELRIRKADNAERLGMLQADVEGLERIWAGDFIVTNAFGEVLRKHEIVEILERGVVPYSAFERETETVRLYGDFAVSLGSEIVISSGPESQPVARRFTHVWINVEGEWRLTARHATVVSER